MSTNGEQLLENAMRMKEIMDDIIIGETAMLCMICGRISPDNRVCERCEDSNGGDALGE